MKARPKWKEGLRQQKEVTFIMEKQTRNLREGIETTRRELEAQLAEVDVRSRCAGGGGPGTHSTTVKPPKFDGATSWAVFHRQFEAAAVEIIGRQMRKLLIFKVCYKKSG